jgi:hypothetical protein
MELAGSKGEGRLAAPIGAPWRRNSTKLAAASAINRSTQAAIPAWLHLAAVQLASPARQKEADAEHTPAKRKQAWRTAGQPGSTALRARLCANRIAPIEINRHGAATALQPHNRALALFRNLSKALFP